MFSYLAKIKKIDNPSLIVGDINLATRIIEPIGNTEKVVDLGFNIWAPVGLTELWYRDVLIELDGIEITKYQVDSAKSHLKNLIENKEVLVEITKTNDQSNNYAKGIIYIAGVNVNIELIRKGFAVLKQGYYFLPVLTGLILLPFCCFYS